MRLLYLWGMIPKMKFLEPAKQQVQLLCHNSAGNSMRTFCQWGVCFLATTRMRLTSGCLPFSQAVARNYFSLPSHLTIWPICDIWIRFWGLIAGVTFPQRHRVSNISLVRVFDRSFDHLGWINNLCSCREMSKDYLFILDSKKVLAHDIHTFARDLFQ